MSRRIHVLLTCFLLSISWTACNRSASPQKAAPSAAAKHAENEPVGWPTFHGDATLSGAADLGFDAPLTVAWRYEAADWIANTPVSDLERKLLFFSDDDGIVYALDWEGNLVWSKAFRVPSFGGKEVAEMFDAPLRVVEDALIACGAMGTIYALALHDGSLRWKTETECTTLGSPTAVTTEVEGKSRTHLYFIDQSVGALQCLAFETGEVLWAGRGIDRCDGSPAANASHVVYGSCASALHIFSPETGEMVREIELGQDEQVAAGVVLLGDLLFASTRSGRFVHANARTGRLIWANAACEEEALFTPAVDDEHVVFSGESTVYALRRKDGKLLWKREVDEPSSPVILRDKIAVSARGSLYILDLSDGQIVGTYAVSDDITAPGVAGTRLVVGGGDGVVTAFEPKEGA